MTQGVYDSFNEFFEMVPADSDALKREVYKLRYQVYCLETGFENPECYPEKIESDEYDSRSLHFLIRHRKSATFAATTRLILPDNDHLDRLFPIEKFTQFNNSDLLADVPRDMHLAEASRFCVSKEFKRRKNESGTLTGISDNDTESLSLDERRILPHISIALISCLIKMCYENQIWYCYAAMEPALIRFLASVGVYFIGIGPITNYHGPRLPSIIKVNEIPGHVAKKAPQLWDLITHKGHYQ